MAGPPTISPALRVALAQYLRTVLHSAARASAAAPVSAAAVAAGAGCAHDLRHSEAWARRRRLDLPIVHELAAAAGGRCDHELLVHLCER